MAKFPSKEKTGEGEATPLSFHSLTGIAAFGEPYRAPAAALTDQGLVCLRGLGEAKTYTAGQAVAQIASNTMWPKAKVLITCGNGNIPGLFTLLAVLPDGKIAATLEIVSWIPVFDDKVFDTQ